MDTNLRLYQEFLEWLITNPSLIDARKIADYARSQASTIDDALLFSQAVIAKSTKKRSTRQSNIVRHNTKQRERFNA